MNTGKNIEEILSFWFRDSDLNPDKAKERFQVWFNATPEFDHEIKERFEALMIKAGSSELENWKNTPEGCLALIILLDQFTRNVYRKTKAAFSGDSLAIQIAKHGVEMGFDERLSVLYRVFMYMPFMHSEVIEDQERSVALFEKLEAESASDWKEVFSGNVYYAREHREVVKRFGRFPHRNRASGRESTMEELEYLEKGGERYGQ
ncbi:MAG: DUF924 domain-containing protein [Desulfobacterales bacterium]|nr:DUF924 domain-containing protein [Desulfobacterales bacterium]